MRNILFMNDLIYIRLSHLFLQLKKGRKKLIIESKMARGDQKAENQSSGHFTLKKRHIQSWRNQEHWVFDAVPLSLYSKTWVMLRRREQIQRLCTLMHFSTSHKNDPYFMLLAHKANKKVFCLMSTQCEPNSVSLSRFMWKCRKHCNVLSCTATAFSQINLNKHVSKPRIGLDCIQVLVCNCAKYSIISV